MQRLTDRMRFQINILKRYISHVLVIRYIFIEYPAYRRRLI
jgi:hypothetical protein